MSATIIHQQLLLIEYNREGGSVYQDGFVYEDSSEWRKWPQMFGLSTDESRSLFDIMQELNWVVGFPLDGWIVFKLTNLGNSLIANLMSDGIGAVHVDLPEEQLAMVSNIGGNSVFVVHSDSSSANGLAKNVQEFIVGSTGKTAIMLEPTPGQTLWEEFEKQASNCAAAVCVWSPDRDNPESLYIRPNVLLETGYFMARLGKGKVIVIKEDDKLRSPSDLAGIVWATRDNWRAQLPRALHVALANKEQR